MIYLKASEPCTFIDYGCGRGHLAQWVRMQAGRPCEYYDPAFHDHVPTTQRDWLLCCDVLEHIAESGLAQIFAEFRRLARCGLLLTIANMSDVHLVNGEPVELHLIRQTVGWWIDRMRPEFPGAQFTFLEINSDRFTLIVEFPS